MVQSQYKSQKRSYLCPVCAIDESSHSLTKLTEINNIMYYYTCPSKAKLYDDTTGIINHYNGVLSEIPEGKKWVWVFDSDNFELKHFLQIDVGIKLAKLITTKFSHNLNKIIIINPTFYISATYNIIQLFLNENVRSIIEFNYEIKTSHELLKNI
jgi:hypothetical protein